MKIFFTSRFRRSHKRLVSKSSDLRELVRQKMMLFEKDPTNPVLKDHALRAIFHGYRAFSIGYDLRIVYRKEKTTWIFFDIGTHNEVYH